MTPQKGSIIGGSFKDRTTIVKVFAECDHILKECDVVIISRKDYFGLLECKKELEVLKNKT